MASIIGDSNPRHPDSEESAANSAGEEPEEEKETSTTTTKIPALDPSAESRGKDEGDCDARTPTAEPSSDSIEVIVGGGGGERTRTRSSKDGSDYLVPGLEEEVENQKDKGDESKESRSGDVDAEVVVGDSTSGADHPPPMPVVSTVSQRPSGLSPAAFKGKPKGLSRGNARNASSTFHAVSGGGGGGRTQQQQSASKIIAETFAKQKTAVEASKSNNKEAVDGGQAHQKHAIITNANFTLVDRPKRVISDD